jgi:hypothetical protein
MPLDTTHHHHQSAASSGPGGDDTRPANVFHQPGYSAGPYSSAQQHAAHHQASAIATSSRRHSHTEDDSSPRDLFPDIPEAKKRKFILVEDNVRGSRLRVRVTLEGVNTKEIPDSFRKGSSVFPRSYFPREMQSPPPSPTGSRFFGEDFGVGPGEVEDDGVEETEGREISRRRGRASAAAGFAREREMVVVRVPIGEGQEGEVGVPRMRRAVRGKEVRLNELGYRMAWLQSRVFAGRTVFLQRACKLFSVLAQVAFVRRKGRVN